MAAQGPNLHVNDGGADALARAHVLLGASTNTRTRARTHAHTFTY